MMNPEKIDTLGQKMGEAALRTLIRLVPNIREIPNDRLEAACAAMRATAKGAVDQLLADAKAAPWLAEVAFTSAVLTVAQAGVEVLRDNPADADPTPPAGTAWPEARVSPEDQKRIDASAAGYEAGRQAAPRHRHRPTDSHASPSHPGGNRQLPRRVLGGGAGNPLNPIQALEHAMPNVTIFTPDGAILGPNHLQAARNLIGDWYTGPGQTLTVDDLRADPDWPADLPTQALRDALRGWVQSGQMERIGRGVYRFT